QVPPYGVPSAASEPDTSVASDHAASPAPNSNTAPESNRPEGGSSANAYQHGCSGTGKIMTPNDKAKAEQIFDQLRQLHNPRTPLEERLLRTPANEYTPHNRCQETLFALTDAISTAATLHWDLDQTVAAQELAARLRKDPALVHTK